MKNKFGRAGHPQLSSSSLLFHAARKLAQQTRENLKAMGTEFKVSGFDLLVDEDMPGPLGQTAGTNTVIFSMSQRGTATGKIIRTDFDLDNNRLTLDRSGNRRGPDKAVELFPFTDIAGMKQQTSRLESILREIIHQYKDRGTPGNTPVATEEKCRRYSPR